MRNKTQKTVKVCFLCLLTFCIYPALSIAVLAVQSEVVSGDIIQKFENQTVKLDNGELYQPSREDLAVTIEVGEPVTLRYVVEDDGEKVFFDFAPGLNSLPNLQQVPVRNDNSPK